MSEADKIIKEIGEVPTNFEAVQENPIYKPLNEYIMGVSQITEDATSESNLLKIKNEEVDFLLKTGEYEDSRIVNRYKSLTESYVRQLLIYSRYTRLADVKIGDVKKVVEEFYISKKKHKTELNNLNQRIVEIKEDYEKEISKLQKEIKDLKIKKPEEEIKEISEQPEIDNPIKSKRGRKKKDGPLQNE